jgi:hypothetical protein
VRLRSGRQEKRRPEASRLRSVNVDGESLLVLAGERGGGALDDARAVPAGKGSRLLQSVEKRGRLRRGARLHHHVQPAHELAEAARLAGDDGTQDAVPLRQPGGETFAPFDGLGELDLAHRPIVGKGGRRRQGSAVPGAGRRGIVTAASVRRPHASRPCGARPFTARD